MCQAVCQVSTHIVFEKNVLLLPLFYNADSDLLG